MLTQNANTLFNHKFSYICICCNDDFTGRNEKDRACIRRTKYCSECLVSSIRDKKCQCNTKFHGTTVDGEKLNLACI